jgi:hypothetical protein
MKVGGLNLEDCRPRNSTWEGKNRLGSLGRNPNWEVWENSRLVSSGETYIRSFRKSFV